MSGLLLNPYRFAAPFTPTAATALTLPGTNTHYISTPYHSSWDVLTGDLDLRAIVAPDDWTPDVSRSFISQSNNTGGQRRFNFFMNPGSSAGRNDLLLNWWDSSNTIQGGSPNGQSSVQLLSTFADGATGGVRCTLELNVGGFSNLKFYTRTDANISASTGWTQLGTTKVGSGPTTLHGSTTAVALGSSLGDTANGGSLWSGKYIKAEVRNGVNGTVVGSFDATAVTKTGTRSPSTYTDPQSHVWTPNGTGWDWSTT